MVTRAIGPKVKINRRVYKARVGGEIARHGAQARIITARILVETIVGRLVAVRRTILVVDTVASITDDDVMANVDHITAPARVLAVELSI